MIEHNRKESERDKNQVLLSASVLTQCPLRMQSTAVAHDKPVNSACKLHQRRFTYWIHDFVLYLNADASSAICGYVYKQLGPPAPLRAEEVTAVSEQGSARSPS
jgi:hypothetical protein